MPFEIDHTTVAAYLEVIGINLLLSGDNVIVIAMAAAGLSKELRQRAILTGIAGAALIRIVFAVVAVQLLAVTGITLVGGVMLLWVCWNMFQELRPVHGGQEVPQIAAATDAASAAPDKRLRHAILQIVLADVSMSLDNVLAVAGAASDHVDALVFGLVLSVILMAATSTLVAALLNKYRWLAWLGLALIFYVAAKMIYDSAEKIFAID
jgi:YjbE family integral membrane protein